MMVNDGNKQWLMITNAGKTMPCLPPMTKNGN